MEFLQPKISVLAFVSNIALLLFLESYLRFPFSTTIDTMFVQPRNASSPISVMLLGIFMFLREEQSLNALSPILVTPLGNSTYTNELQYSNVRNLISVTPLGILMCSNVLQPRNAYFPILVTLSGISILFSKAQYSNALSPISVTPSGILAYSIFLSINPIKTAPSILNILLFSMSSINVLVLFVKVVIYLFFHKNDFTFKQEGLRH